MKLKQFFSPIILAALLFAAILPKAQAATISITSTSLPAATVGQAYAATIQFNFLAASPLYATFSGLPAGIAYPTTALYTNNAFGTGSLSLSGTPTVAGTFTVSMVITDNGTSSATQSFNLLVNAAIGTPSPTPSPIPPPPPVVSPVAPTPLPAPIPAPSPVSPAPVNSPSFINPIFAQPPQPAPIPAAPAPSAPAAINLPPTPSLVPLFVPVNFPDGTLVKIDGNLTIFMVVGGGLSPFTSAAVFKSRNLKFSDVKTVSSSVIALAPYLAPVTFAEKALLRASSKTVYLVLSGKKLGIASLQVFKRLKLSFKNVIIVGDSELAALPDGGVQN